MSPHRPDASARTRAPPRSIAMRTARWIAVIIIVAGCRSEEVTWLSFECAKCGARGSSRDPAGPPVWSEPSAAYTQLIGAPHTHVYRGGGVTATLGGGGVGCGIHDLTNTTEIEYEAAQTAYECLSIPELAATARRAKSVYSEVYEAVAACRDPNARAEALELARAQQLDELLRFLESL